MPTYDELVQPASGFKGLYYAFLRAALRVFGPLSDGMRLGLTHGFDSGVMLEYVYRNEPSGRWGVGKWLDEQFLGTPGWRGIRERRELMKRALREVIGENQARGEGTRLLDVACGGGRYVLEVLREFPAEAVDATLRDYAEVNVRKAQELAQAFGVQAHIEQADAFSDDDLGRVQPQPNLIIVSGLHEILPDDALIERHFIQLGKLLEPGDTLLYTVQPHHPQLELIARTLNAHTGGPWVMRLRSLEKVQGWAEASGFHAFRVQIDSEGIFGVVRARKT